MKRTALFLLAMMVSGYSYGQSQPIDVQSSKLTIHVYKTGLFSFAAHDHEIVAPITVGAISDGKKASVSLRVDARQLQVLDQKESAGNRAKIQKTMLGPEVLDSERFPEIVFHSIEVRSIAIGQWNVKGELTLHGQTKPVTVEVRRAHNTYTGTAQLKQTEFGITPVSIAGGTVKVKDEIKIEFEIATR